MILAVLVTFLNLFVAIFNVLLIARVIGSYILSPTNRLFMVVAGITEPILEPVRRFLPAMGGVDLSPLAAFVLLNGLQYVVTALLMAGS